MRAHLATAVDVGIQYDRTEGAGLDARSVQELFLEEISLSYLRIEYLHPCHAIYTCKIAIDRGSSQLTIS